MAVIYLFWMALHQVPVTWPALQTRHAFRQTKQCASGGSVGSVDAWSYVMDVYDPRLGLGSEA